MRTCDLLLLGRGKLSLVLPLIRSITKKNKVCHHHYHGTVTYLKMNVFTLYNFANIKFLWFTFLVQQAIYLDDYLHKIINASAKLVKQKNLMIIIGITITINLTTIYILQK